MLDALYELCSNPICWSLFGRPVVEQHPEIAEVYSEVIKRPLDLSTVIRRARAGAYDSEPPRLARRVLRIFKNCERFNSESPQYREAAKHLRRHWDALWQFYVEWPLRPVPSSRAGSEDLRREKESWRQRWYAAGRVVTLSSAEEARVLELLKHEEFDDARTLVQRNRAITLEKLFETVVNSPPARKRVPPRLDAFFCLLSLRCSERRTRGADLSFAWAAALGLRYARGWPVLFLGDENDREDALVLAINVDRVGAALGGKKEGSCLVEFLGSHDFGWLKPDALKGSGDKSRLPKRKHDRHVYDAARAEAERAELFIATLHKEDDLDADRAASELVLQAATADYATDNDGSSTDDDMPTTTGATLASLPPIFHPRLQQQHQQQPSPHGHQQRRASETNAETDESRVPLKKRKKLKKSVRAPAPAAVNEHEAAADNDPLPAPPLKKIPKIVVARKDILAAQEAAAAPAAPLPPPPPKKQAVSQRPREPTTKATKRERERAARAAKREQISQPAVAVDRRKASADKVAVYLDICLQGRPVKVSAHDEPSFAPPARVNRAQSDRSKQQATKEPTAPVSLPPVIESSAVDDVSAGNEGPAKEGPPLSESEIERCRRLAKRALEQEAAQAAVDRCWDEETESEPESTRLFDLSSSDQEQRIRALEGIKLRLEADIRNLEEMEIRVDRFNAARTCAAAAVDEMKRERRAHKEANNIPLDEADTLPYVDPFVRLQEYVRAEAKHRKVSDSVRHRATQTQQLSDDEDDDHSDID